MERMERVERMERMERVERVERKKRLDGKEKESIRQKFRAGLQHVQKDIEQKDCLILNTTELDEREKSFLPSPEQ